MAVCGGRGERMVAGAGCRKRLAVPDKQISFHNKHQGEGWTERKLGEVKGSSVVDQGSSPIRYRAQSRGDVG